MIHLRADTTLNGQILDLTCHPTIWKQLAGEIDTPTSSLFEGMRCFNQYQESQTNRIHDLAVSSMYVSSHTVYTTLIGPE
jgi:hypothetical protein